jgi:hypothetical protein
MTKIIDLEIEKKMRLSLDNLFNNEWKFITEEQQEPKLKVVKRETNKNV